MVTVDDGVNSLSRRGLEVLGEPKADLQRECPCPGQGQWGWQEEPVGWAPAQRKVCKCAGIGLGYQWADTFEELDS